MAATNDETRRRWRSRLRKALLAGTLLLAALVYLGFLLPFWGIPFNHSRHGHVPLTPPWALECWLWEDDVNTEARVNEMLEGYAKHDLPVRTILIDSPWSCRYNDFKVDEKRYPEPERFFKSLRGKGYRIVLWMTCMVNSFNKDTAIKNSESFYEAARAKGYLAGSGHQIEWWKGKGAFIDYSDPKALTWWHGLQEQILDWGVDGWKLDGCDSLFSSTICKLPIPFSRVHSGWMTTREYMDKYTREEYRHGLSRNPKFAILVRAKDHPWIHPEGFSPLDAATVTWVGDNRHTWSYQDWGLQAAIADILASARLGYCVVGSDVGGYHGRSQPDDIRPATGALLSSWKSKESSNGAPSSEFNLVTSKNEIAPNLYIRWAEFSAFCGLFLNGGHGERCLWKRSPPELEVIRKFSWLHTELVPYSYSHVVACHNGGRPLMRPLAKGRFHYLFGDDFLVAPVYEDKLARRVSLPAGGWRYLFEDHELFQGPAEFTRDIPLDEFPVFVREGAVVPLKVRRSYTGFGDKDSADFTTWLIYPKGRNGFTLWHPETHPKPEATTVTVDSGNPLRIEISGKREPHILRVFAEQKPATVSLDGQALQEGAAWVYNSEARKLIIRTHSYREGKYAVSWP